MGKSIIYDFLCKLFVSLALAGVTLFVYSPCFHHPFINYDDPDYVAQNQYVKAGLTIDGVRWAFTTFACGNWHPLTWLSLQLDAWLYGSSEADGFHVTNVLLHTANTLLLFLVLGRMTGSVWRSGVVAALFALHPLHVESVAWVAERKDVLGTLFWMLTLAAYLHYVRRPGVRRYLLVLLALGLGLLAKPMLVTLPFVLLLLDYWPLRRLPILVQDSNAVTQPATGLESCPTTGNLASAIVEKLPLLALVMVSCVVTFLAQLHSRAVVPFEKFSLVARLANALWAYVAYLGKMVWPTHLAVFYPHPGPTVSVALALGAGLLLVLFTVLALGPGRRWPYLAVGWLWYLGTLVPVIGLVQVGGQGMADRYTYVPLIGLFLLVTWGVSDLVLAWRLPRYCLVVATSVVLSVCAALTWTQQGYWQNALQLWEHAAAVTKRNVLAHLNLGACYYERGRIAAAKKEFEKGLEIEPKFAGLHMNLGNALADLDLQERALAEYQQAIDLEPNNALAHNNLGKLLWKLGRLQEALVQYRRAIALDSDPGTYVNLGVVLWDLGRLAEAVDEYRRAIALDPNQVQAHNNFGIALIELGRRDEAVQEFRRAIALDPRSAELHTHLGQALQEAGRLEAAAAEYGQAIKLGDKRAEPSLRSCERLQALRPRLPSLVTGRDRPADSAQRLEFAELCRQPWVRLYALAAGLYNDAFADPNLADDVRAANRFKAAGAYAAAGCGLGQDETQPKEEKRAQLRRQALSWLRAELALLAKPAQMDNPQARAMVRQALRIWRRDPSLAGVRDPAALTQLTDAEREAWHKLWQEVAAVRARAAAPPEKS